MAVRLLLLIFTVFSINTALAITPEDRGASLFRQHCSACHGFSGNGGVGVPLALPSFINSVDDRYLIQTIRLGRPGRIMPAFDHLKPAQIEQMVRYMRTWTGQVGPVYGNKMVVGNKTRGAVLYKQHCASCHGIDGKGGQGTGVTYSRPRSLPILAPALNNSGFLGSATDSLIEYTIGKGRRGTPMPAFSNSGVLSKSEINDIVSFIRGYQTDRQPNVLASKGPGVIVRESPYPLDQTISRVKDAVAAANMKLIRVQALEDGLVPAKKVATDKQIVYACGFGFLDKALKVDSRVGLFLPCRITVIKHKDTVRIMAINPKQLSVFFNNHELDELCEQMYSTYVNILDEAVF